MRDNNFSNNGRDTTGVAAIGEALKVNKTLLSIESEVSAAVEQHVPQRRYRLSQPLLLAAAAFVSAAAILPAVVCLAAADAARAAIPQSSTTD